MHKDLPVRLPLSSPPRQEDSDGLYSGVELPLGGHRPVRTVQLSLGCALGDGIG